jgi:hypothetical protein
MHPLALLSDDAAFAVHSQTDMMHKFDSSDELRWDEGARKNARSNQERSDVRG